MAEVVSMKRFAGIRSPRSCRASNGGIILQWHSVNDVIRNVAQALRFADDCEASFEFACSAAPVRHFQEGDSFVRWPNYTMNAVSLRPT
jgi:hypothetical protein